MTSWVLLVALTAASAQPASVSGTQATSDAKTGSPSRSSATTSTKITVTGFLSRCYKPKGYLVFITSIPRATPNFESETQVLRADGRFTFVLDAAKLKPGDYGLNFGRTKGGAGFQRFTVTSGTTKINLGQMGDCDV